MSKNEGKPTSGDRDEIINWRIANMTKFAADLKPIVWDRFQEAKNDLYIRIGGESMQAVSLKDESALSGCGKPRGKLDDIVVEAKKPPKRLGEGSKKGEEYVFNRKKERRLQAHIIKKSLEDNGSLLGAKLFKCLGSTFDELVFVTDEISFGDRDQENTNELPMEFCPDGKKANRPDTVRCDILAVGKIGKETHPVLIELKSDRSLKRLFEQLDNASFDIGDHRNPNGGERRNSITELVKEITGKKISSSFDVKKILVWPGGKSSLQTAKRIAESKVICIDYSEKDFTNPNDVEFTLYGACAKSP
mgnify:CR=1 FL=1|tara:strand:- start:1304 stop:2218 length:915 start_codon:yes stop_codon:yes gene_type:complete